MVNLGMAIRLLRHARGMKLKQVAGNGGVCASVIQHAEVGKRLPSVNALNGIARGLGVSADLLFAIRDGGPTKPEDTELWTRLALILGHCRDLETYMKSVR